MANVILVSTKGNAEEYEVHEEDLEFFQSLFKVWEKKGMITAPKTLKRKTLKVRLLRNLLSIIAEDENISFSPVALQLVLAHLKEFLRRVKIVNRNARTVQITDNDVEITLDMMKKEVK